MLFGYLLIYVLPLYRKREECQSELSNLEQMKKPLINQKDQLLKEILKLEDLLKKSKAELNRIHSESSDTSDLQRQVSI